jgi:DNA-binding IclR family transcriptional regulator
MAATVSTLPSSFVASQSPEIVAYLQNIENAANSLSTTVDGLGSTYSKILRTINPQTGTSYTFATTDSGSLVTFSNASAITVTVPPNSSVALSVGAQIDVAQTGAGKVTLAQGSGVTINSLAGNKSLSAQYAAGTLVKTDTNTWLLTGSLIA